MIVCGLSLFEPPEVAKSFEEEQMRIPQRRFLAASFTDRVILAAACFWVATGWGTLAVRLLTAAAVPVSAAAETDGSTAVRAPVPTDPNE